MADHGRVQMGSTQKEVRVAGKWERERVQCQSRRPVARLTGIVANWSRGGERDQGQFAAGCDRRSRRGQVAGEMGQFLVGYLQGDVQTSTGRAKASQVIHKAERPFVKSPREVGGDSAEDHARVV